MSAYPATPVNRLDAASVRRLIGLPPRALRALAGRPVVVDGQTLHPEVQLLLRLMALRRDPALETLDPPDAREEIRNSAAWVAGRPLDLARVEERSVQGADGPLRARLFVPHERAGSEPGPLLVFFHGGGWVVGDLDSHDAPCRLLARSAGARVLSVDYRLAPEHRYPAAADDAFASFRQVAANAADFGADPARIAVGGDSAGGNVAAVCCQLARADGGPVPVFQLLIYPVTDNAHQETASYHHFWEGFFLTGEQMRWYRAHYFGDREAALAPELKASPLLADDCSGLPPAHVVTAGFDPLRDEGEAYAARLHEAGVRVTTRRHTGLIHGFINAVGAGHASRDGVVEMGGVLRASLTA